MFLEVGEFERVVNDDYFKDTSKKYYKGEVISAIEIVHIGYDHFYSIKGTCELNDEIRQAFIALTEKGKVRSHHCDCDDHKSSSACAHVGAVLLKIQQLEPRSYPFYYKNDQRAHWESIMANIREEKLIEETAMIKERSQKLLESLKQDSLLNFSLDLNQKKAHLEVTLVQDQGLFVSYRVGEDSMYVVKDLIEFLRLIDTKEKFNYGQRLNLIHDPENFDTESQKQIKFLNHLVSEQTKFELSSVDKFRSLPLSDQSMDAFFETYHEMGHTYKKFETYVSDEKLLINVDQNADGHYMLTFDDERVFYMGLKHLYYFSRDALVQYKMDSKGKAVQLLKELMALEMVLIDQDQMQDFASYVLNDLRQYIEFAGFDFENELKENPEILLYGDVDAEARICLKLEAKVQDQIIDGFTQHDIMGLKQVESVVQQYAMTIEGNIAIFDDVKDSTYDFFQLGVPQLAHYATVFISDELKKMGTPKRYSVKVGIGVAHNLLELDFESSEIPKDQLAAVLESYKLKKKFHRLKSGELITLESQELAAIDELLTTYDVDSKDIGKEGVIALPTYRMFSMENFSNDHETLKFEKNASFVSSLQSFKEPDIKDYTLPKHYTDILRDYQVEGYTWFRTLCNYGFGGILADDMGLGKTVQMITLMETMKSNDGKPSIVVCPSSILLNWHDEIQKFSKELSSLCIMGTKEERDALILKTHDYDVVITSYDYLRRDIEAFDGKDFNCIILDEAQYIKNQRTMNAQSVKKINGDYRFALSGTPIENTLAELWSIFDFLMPGYLYSYPKFVENFEKPIVRDGDVDAQNKLKQLIEPFILRRMKKDVLKELPDKIETTLKFEFNPDEKKLYQAHLASVNESIHKEGGEAPNSIAILAMLTRLRQICTEPRVLFDNIANASSKMLGALDLIETLRENKQKVLLFSSFTSVLDLMASELDARNISYFMLTGATDREERRNRVQQFQNDDTEVFLISLKAGGTGINLTSAQAVIHFDPWWNVSAQNQATDRAYRIGQNNNVQVFKLIMKDSVEEKIIELQEKKQDLFETFVENNEGSITKMSKSDIVALFE